MKFNKILFIWATFSVNFVQPYIIRIDALKKQFPKIKKTQYIINAGDVHFGCCDLPGYIHPTLTRKAIAKINKNHAQALINFTKKYPKEDCLFILEDSYNYQGKYKPFKQDIKLEKKINNLNDYTICMSFLNDHCKDHKIAVKNIEFRQTFGLFLRNKIVAKHFLRDLYGILNEIKMYNDSPKFNKYYNRLLNNFFKSSSKLLKILLMHKEKFLNDIPAYNFIGIDFIKCRNNFYELIDARIVHRIYKNRNKKYIFVCAGNDHIKGINKILSTVNYKTISSKKNYIFKPLKVKLQQKNISALV